MCPVALCWRRSQYLVRRAKGLVPEHSGLKKLCAPCFGNPAAEAGPQPQRPFFIQACIFWVAKPLYSFSVSLGTVIFHLSPFESESMKIHGCH